MRQIAMFRVGDISFGLAFVTRKRDTFDKLKNAAESNGFVLDIFGTSADGDTYSLVSEKSREDANADNFLKELKNNEKWFQDREVIDDTKMMIFYHSETLKLMN